MVRSFATCTACAVATAILASGSAFAQVRVFIAPPAEVDDAPPSGPIITAADAGTAVVLDVWIAGSSALALNGHQLFIPRTLAPMGGATGTVTYLDLPPLDSGAGDSAFIDVARSDWLFAGASAGPAYLEDGATDRFGLIYSQALGAGSAIAAEPAYLGSFTIDISPDACGTFELTIPGDSGVPVTHFFQPFGAEFPIDLYQPLRLTVCCPAGCDDGDLCTVDDCVAGVCLNDPVDCPRRGTVCDPADGACKACLNEAGPCDDGDPCTTDGVCTDGVCVGGMPVVCPPTADPCAAQACDPLGAPGNCDATVAENDGLPCDDDQFCTTGEICSAGACGDGVPTDCSLLDGACTLGVCSNKLAACVALPADDGTACDDGVNCTELDGCESGVCVGVAPDCSSLDGPCAIGVCDETTGACTAASANDGMPCEDGLLCTAQDVCVAGVCSGQAVDCSALDATCVVGSCDERSGACVALTAPDGTPCADDNGCTITEACAAGVCVAPPHPDCPQGVVSWVDPPDGVVDARQPNPIDGAEPLLGIDTFMVDAPADADAGCWCLCERSAAGLDPNSILDVSEQSPGSYVVVLERALTPGETTTLTYGNTHTAVFRSHPANVNGDTLAGPLDILAIIDILNGVLVPPFGAYSADVDHSGVVAPLDILRVIDLLNGGDALDPWLGTPLPPPVCP